MREWIARLAQGGRRGSRRSSRPDYGSKQRHRARHSGGHGSTGRARSGELLQEPRGRGGGRLGDLESRRRGDGGRRRRHLARRRAHHGGVGARIVGARGHPGEQRRRPPRAPHPGRHDRRLLGPSHGPELEERVPVGQGGLGRDGGAEERLHHQRHLNCRAQRRRPWSCGVRGGERRPVDLHQGAGEGARALRGSGQRRGSGIDRYTLS